MGCSACELSGALQVSGGSTFSQRYELTGALKKVVTQYSVWESNLGHSLLQVLSAKPCILAVDKCLCASSVPLP